MKTLALFVLLLLAGILIQLLRKKPPEAEKDATPIRKSNPEKTIIGKSRVVLRYQSQPQTLAATDSESEDPHENNGNFELDNEPLNLQLELKYDSPKPVLEDMDAEVEEDIQLVMEGESPLANGFIYEEMSLAVGEVTHPSGKHNTQAAEILYRMQDTECVAQLTALSPEKAAHIHNLINRHIETVIATQKKE
ncbi:hypothetical protein [uncultured Proteiniphilum sp.]|uniref:hypothetical protein n=1 Tax=uncultured Proteiniphilum sp. TaxID=497637 RepID=UPI00261376B8|nr:hypothetical protein [uncultured Proteiniphilum sp.]